jgi:hypothetical protein
MLILCAPLVMFPSRHPCIDASECNSFGGFFHHHVEERINTKKFPTQKTPLIPLKPPNYCPKRRVFINKTKN